MQVADAHESHADEHHEAEHAAPAEGHMDPTANDGRDRGRDAKYHGDGAHQTLRFRPFMQIAHDGAPDCHSHARTHPLHHSKRQ